MRAKSAGLSSETSTPARASGARAADTARAARERARTAEVQDAEDTKAMLAFQNGDASAFDRLIRRHQRALYNFCYRMLGSPAAAEDSTQEVLLKMVRATDRWTPSARVRTWMYRIARNHCIDELRKAKHRQTESMDRPLQEEGAAGGGTLGDRLADSQAVPPDRGAASLHLRERLIQAIQALPEEQREVFLMREQAGLPFKEIADVVGVPENTAKSRMRYALEALRASLAQGGVTKSDAAP